MINHRCRQIASLAVQDHGQAPAERRAEALENVLQRFDDMLAAMGRARTTRRLYASMIRAWLRAGGQAHRIDVEFLTRRLAARRRQICQASLNIELQALRTFYRCMAIAGSAPAGIERAIPRGHRPPKRIPRWFTDEQVGTLLAQPDISTFIGLRDHTMIRVLYEAGLRASELIGLQCTDVLPDGAVYVERGKGGHSRIVPIGIELLQLLETYMRTRASRRPGKRNALWIRADGIPLRGARSAWEIVNRYARAALGCAAGYDRVRYAAKRKPWSGQYPHMLRAAFATELLRNGCPLPPIAQMLGHVSLDSTALYLGVDIAQLRAAIAKHPRAVRNPS